MRKFKVIIKWPGGPKVGETLVQSESNAYPKYAYQQDGRGNGWEVGQLEGFVEEIIENEVFWVLGNDGTIYKAENGNYFGVPNWMRFRTKESAEKLAKVLKDSHNWKEKGIKDDLYFGFHMSFLYEMILSINDRVK